MASVAVGSRPGAGDHLTADCDVPAHSRKVLHSPDSRRESRTPSKICYRIGTLSCALHQSGIGPRQKKKPRVSMEGVQTLVTEYLPVVIFLVIAAVLSVLFIVLSTLFAPKKPDAEKLSAYECGFNAFDDARMKFDVRFYL